MYRKYRQGWMKNLDFMIIDMLCLQIAFILSPGVCPGAGGYPPAGAGPAGVPLFVPYFNSNPFSTGL